MSRIEHQVVEHVRKGDQWLDYPSTWQTMTTTLKNFMELKSLWLVHLTDQPKYLPKLDPCLLFNFLETKVNKNIRKHEIYKTLQLKPSSITSLRDTKKRSKKQEKTLNNTLSQRDKNFRKIISLSKFQRQVDSYSIKWP